jgi:dTDP-4-amino-4,6-dideoxygalactose transaminase
MRPQLPTADQLRPYLERIDATRYYSNHGSLLAELEQRLAAHFGVAPERVALVANGTVALSAALVAVGAAPRSKCLLPSWTFVASAAAVWAANLQPHFVDVSPSTWMLDPESVKRRSDLNEVGAVMAVSAFGAPVDTQAWDDFSAETGIPVVIDGAAAFDTVASIPTARAGRTPVMISLHATKVLGIGEGGLLISTDESTINRFQKICNFGVWGSPDGQILGYNGKLSEYHAAVGLAALDGWEVRRSLIADLTQKYVRRLATVSGASLLPTYGNGWVSCYCNVRTDCEAADIIGRLAAAGIETRRWWQSGVHNQSAYRSFTRDHLPVTAKLSSRVFGLPFFHDMSDAQLERTAVALDDALNA